MTENDENECTPAQVADYWATKLAKLQVENDRLDNQLRELAVRLDVASRANSKCSKELAETRALLTESKQTIIALQSEKGTADMIMKEAEIERLTSENTLVKALFNFKPNEPFNISLKNLRHNIGEVEIKNEKAAALDKIYDLLENLVGDDDLVKSQTGEIDTSEYRRRINAKIYSILRPLYKYGERFGAAETTGENHDE